MFWVGTFFRRGSLHPTRPAVSTAARLLTSYLLNTEVTEDYCENHAGNVVEWTHCPSCWAVQGRVSLFDVNWDNVLNVTLLKFDFLFCSI